MFTRWKLHVFWMLIIFVIQFKLIQLLLGLFERNTVIEFPDWSPQHFFMCKNEESMSTDHFDITQAYWVVTLKYEPKLSIFVNNTVYNNNWIYSINTPNRATIVFFILKQEPKKYEYTWLFFVFDLVWPYEPESNFILGPLSVFYDEEKM